MRDGGNGDGARERLRPVQDSEVEAAYIRGLYDGAQQERRSHKPPAWRRKRSGHISAWVWFTVAAVVIFLELAILTIALLDPDVTGGVDIEFVPDPTTSGYSKTKT